MFDENNKTIEPERIYCNLCLVHEQTRDHGHISQVSNFSEKIASGNLNNHLRDKHDISTSGDEQTNRILGYLKKYDPTKQTESATAATSLHEINRDLLLWFCRDLEPFEMVSKGGFAGFFAKNVPYISLPTPETLSTTALNDVYEAIQIAVKTKLEGVKSVCIMMDGWTDKYKARPYLGVRVAFVKDWSYDIVTLGVHVVPSQTARTVSDHVNNLLRKYFAELKQMFITSCHDSAANMVAASKLLKVDSYQHCAAHALHLLLTVDSINTIDEAAAVLQKCRNIVTSLHFKTYQLEDEIAASADKDEMQKLLKTVADVSEVLNTEDQFSMDTQDDNTTENANVRHMSLKAACPTRWNSTLHMVDSILQLRNEVQIS